jgi:alpha-glucosidase
MNHTGQIPADPLTFLLHPSGGSGESSLYEDAGDGFDYESGEYARRTITCEMSDGRVTVRLGEREGSFAPERGRVVLELRGLSDPRSVTANGEEAGWSREGGSVRVELPETPEAVTVELET